MIQLPPNFDGALLATEVYQLFGEKIVPLVLIVLSGWCCVALIRRAGRI